MSTNHTKGMPGVGKEPLRGRGKFADYFCLDHFVSSLPSSPSLHTASAETIHLFSFCHWGPSIKILGNTGRKKKKDLLGLRGLAGVNHTAGCTAFIEEVEKIDFIERFLYHVKMVTLNTG